ncbi:MAG TPA: hypothetical protein PKO06_19905 [Candidatus Ozemobacteraceae bacterium]|nr:hypothetical protein [Candidatus Ozemobacteraceae bacterium]
MNALWPGKQGEWTLKMILLIVIEGILLLTDWILPTEVPILPRIQAGFWEGLVIGFVVWVLWRLLCGFETSVETGKEPPAASGT